jgi:hypothetical protein
MAIVYAFAALGVAMLAQTAAIWLLSSRIRGAERLDRRLSHFAEALALLTDTTESGLANVAIELEQASRNRASRPAAAPRSTVRSTTPRATARRIATAASSGRTVADIAADEAMSESEVMLHLGMRGDQVSKGARDGPLRI